MTARNSVDTASTNSSSNTRVEDEKTRLERNPATTGLTATILGAILAGFVAWRAIFIPLDRNAAFANEVRSLEMKLKYVEAQLEKCYGPLLAECIEADGTFRRVEIALEKGTGGQIKHYDFRDLTHEHFHVKYDQPGSYPCEEGGVDTKERYLRFFARMLTEVFLPSNEKRMKIIRNTLHLLGPAPPTSIALFVSHAAQLKGLVTIKKYLRMEVSSAPDGENRYADPYLLTPFPTVMAGEIAAKVALLKALQREFSYLLGRVSVKRRKKGLEQPKQEPLVDKAEEGQKQRPSKPELRDGTILRRQDYYLLLRESLWDELNCETDPHFDDRPPSHRAFYPLTFPLVWGPYKAVELFEFRSWLIIREQFIRNMPGLRAERIIYLALLQADVACHQPRAKVEDISNVPKAPKPRVAKRDPSCAHEVEPVVARGKAWEAISFIPLSHRVGQPFDELDQPGAKKNNVWDEHFTWENMQTEPYDTYLARFDRCGYHLHNLPAAGGFAYEEEAYYAMRGI